MTEDEARAWLDKRLDVPRETFAAIERYLALLAVEAEKQNLIARSTQDQVWARHVVDSAQLVALAGSAAGRWIDLGSGAGFPGLIIAALGGHVLLVESRRRRAEFLGAAAAAMRVESRVRIAATRVETLPDDARFDRITARAFAPLERLLPLAARFADRNTLWLLPKGRGAASELDAARGTWQGDFRIEASVTDAEAAIIVATNVRPKGKR